MAYETSLSSLTDDDLLGRLAQILRQSRRVEADLVAHIGEVDGRLLYAREGSPSMFAYCVEALHLSEAEAYLRIAAARAAREHPVVLVMLADGRLHLSGIAKLAPRLTRETGEALLDRAAHKTKRQIEELLAEISPRPDVPAIVRKLPERTAVSRLGPDGVAMTMPASAGIGSAAFDLEDTVRTDELRPDRVASSNTSASIQPLSPSRYRVQFTASGELREKLKRLRALMRSEVPDGDLGAILERAVTEKLERLEARRIGKTEAPRKTLGQTDTSRTSRQIPAAVRRAVWRRDGGRCRFVDA